MSEEYIKLDDEGEVILEKCTLKWENSDFDEDFYLILLEGVVIGHIEPSDLVGILKQTNKEYLLMNLKRKVSNLSMQISDLEESK